jgi:hypothetical protein
MNQEKLFKDLKVLQEEFVKTHYKYPSEVDNMLIELAMKQAVNLVLDNLLDENRMETFNLMRKG